MVLDPRFAGVEGMTDLSEEVASADLDVILGSENAAKRSPETFVSNPQGSLDFGEITPEIAAAIHRQPGKIRLRNGTDAWGLIHIKNRHEKQIKQLGYSGVEDFVNTIAHDFNAIHRRGWWFS